MSGLWCAVDYDGNELAHSARDSKKIGSNQREKKRVRIVREVQGPSLSVSDYAKAADEQRAKGNTKKANQISDTYRKRMAAETGLNSKGVATKNAKNAHQLSITKTTKRQNKANGTFTFGLNYSKGDKLTDSRSAKQILGKKKKK